MWCRGDQQRRDGDAVVREERHLHGGHRAELRGARVPDSQLRLRPAGAGGPPGEGGLQQSNYINKYLRLKATFIYYDFDKLLTAADANAKPPLLDLATRLFDSFERLQAAVTTKDDADIGSRYADTKLILQEVMTRMA